MTRREFSKATMFATAMLLTAWCAMATFAFATGHRPNFILIVIDDQGYPDLGCIGSKPVLTPTLDRLAAEGVRGTFRDY